MSLQLHSTPPVPGDRPSHNPAEDLPFPPELDPPPPDPPLPEPADEHNGPSPRPILH
jgi:hypothetical protein